jgi:hypothetical protein
MLQRIKILTDYTDENGEKTCDGKTLAELRNPESYYPNMVLCPIAFLQGGIGKSYGIIPFRIHAVKCSNFDKRVSWKMDTLGATLLHEYTHFKMLVVPPLGAQTLDPAYGAYNSRNLDKVQATNNADSFAWAAIENFWSIICNNRDFEDPVYNDAVDPNCGMKICHL